MLTTLLYRGAADSSGRIYCILGSSDKQAERGCFLQDENVIAFVAPSETRHQC